MIVIPNIATKIGVIPNGVRDLRNVCMVLLVRTCRLHEIPRCTRDDTFLCHPELNDTSILGATPLINKLYLIDASSA